MVIKIIKISIITVVAVISFNYFNIYQRGDLNKTNHFKEIGKGVGQTVKHTVSIPGKIIESKQWQEIKEGFDEGSDTTKTK